MHYHKIILGVLLIILVGFAISSVQAKHGNIPLPHPAKATGGDQCVEPSDIMRRNHMTYLMHQRDETVIKGIRGKKYSLQFYMAKMINTRSISTWNLFYFSSPSIRTIYARSSK